MRHLPSSLIRLVDAYCCFFTRHCQHYYEQWWWDSGVGGLRIGQLQACVGAVYHILGRGGDDQHAFTGAVDGLKCGHLVYRVGRSFSSLKPSTTQHGNRSIKRRVFLALVRVQWIDLYVLLSHIYRWVYVG